jgi:hypothetical protein
MTRPQIVLGPTFVVLGVLLLLDQTGQLEAWSIIAVWWPLVVIASGVAQWVTRPVNPLGGAILALVGAVLLAWTLGAITSPALLWPLLLMGIGLWLLLGRFGSRGVGGRGPEARGGAGWSPDVTAVFDDRRVVAPPGPFTGGSATTLFGDVELDLRRAELVDGAVLQVTTIFGDVDVEVPAGWAVKASGPELFGDVTMRPEVGREPVIGTLTLRVLTLFGDLKVQAFVSPTA